MEFLVHSGGSGFGGFGPNFGTVNTLHKDSPLGGCLRLESADQIDMEALDTGVFGGVV